MVSISRAVPVNPPDTAIRLTRADVWRGLELKARNALPFVQAMNRCVVREQGPTSVLRDIEIDGEQFQERVELTPPRRVRFVRTKGRVLGTIDNVIEEDADGELVLRFSFQLEVSGVASGTAEERQYERDMAESYSQAVDSTLAAVRRVADERRHGQAPTAGSRSE